MLCNLTNAVRPKNLAQIHLETLALRITKICPNVMCDIGVSSEGQVLHVTHRLDTNPAYVGKLMRSYVSQSMHDLEIHMPKYILVHLITGSGATMLHCQHELTVLTGDNHA